MSGSHSSRLLVWYTLAFAPIRSGENPESMFTFNIFHPVVFSKKISQNIPNYPKMSQKCILPQAQIVRQAGWSWAALGLAEFNGDDIVWILWRWLSSWDLIFVSNLISAKINGDAVFWYCASDLAVMWCIFKLYKVLKVFNSGSWPVLTQKILLAVVPSPTWLYKQQWRYDTHYTKTKNIARIAKAALHK